MKVGIYGQFYHKNSETYILQILLVLKSRNAAVCIEERFLNEINNNPALQKSTEGISSFKTLDSTYDLFISIGGDGTLLKSVTYVGDLGIPIVGINTGRLGFLATIPKEKITESIHQIFDNNHSISKRSLLQIETNPHKTELNSLNFALNEVAINRKNTTSMIKVETHIDDEYLTSYWSDGLIISTPTGSTGYSLSCGGPVIAPQTGSLIITPIAPHNLNARPFVIPDDSVLTLQVSGREKEYLVSLDSRITTLTNQTIITIKKAPFSINLVQLKNTTFIKTLREKLLWGEDKRN